MPLAADEITKIAPKLASFAIASTTTTTTRGIVECCSTQRDESSDNIFACSQRRRCRQPSPPKKGRVSARRSACPHLIFLSRAVALLGNELLPRAWIAALILIDRGEEYKTGNCVRMIWFFPEAHPTSACSTALTAAFRRPLNQRSTTDWWWTGRKRNNALRK